MLDKVMRQHIEAWRKEYPDGYVPISYLDKFFGMDVVSFIRRTYYYCPVTRTISNRASSQPVGGKMMHAGPGHIPISLTKGEVILKTGIDPWRCGRDSEGLWYKVIDGGEKIYV